MIGILLVVLLWYDSCWNAWSISEDPQLDSTPEPLRFQSDQEACTELNLEVQAGRRVPAKETPKDPDSKKGFPKLAPRAPVVPDSKDSKKQRAF